MDEKKIEKRIKEFKENLDKNTIFYLIKEIKDNCLKCRVWIGNKEYNATTFCGKIKELNLQIGDVFKVINKEIVVVREASGKE